MNNMSKLFSPLKIRGVEYKNRIFVSPMCQYSSDNGKPTDWHLVHLGSRAVGGVACVIMEAAAVSPEGRISPDDLGMWDDGFVPFYKKITDFIKSQNAVAGIQLAHAGRKGSTYTPWKGEDALKKEDGAWQIIAPSPIPFDKGYPTPIELTVNDIKVLKEKFVKAAQRSVEAGFQTIELHMAHGYLVHQFLSPLTNKRTDNYGGSLENRTRFAIKIARDVRNNIPGDIPLFVRLSCTDWVENGWDVEQTIYLSKALKSVGIDLIDCSSGGSVPDAKIPAGVGYQIPFAERIKREAQILTGGVGIIVSPEQAETIIRTNQADVVLLGREMLRNPYWALSAAKVLREDIEWPKQYIRAKN